MLKRKPNQNNARGADPQERDVIPPEEFAGFDEFGEYPEFRPGDRAIETRDDSEDKGRANA